MEHSHLNFADMEYVVYRVLAESETTRIDQDMCPCDSWETFFEDFYSSKEAAIKCAKNLRAEEACYVQVIEYAITDNGMKNRGVVHKETI